MTFTKELPTRDGYFLWKAGGRDSVRVVDVWGFGRDGIRPMVDVAGDHLPRRMDEMGGEWCRLVPSDEVRKARGEGYVTEQSFDPQHDRIRWESSRAWRVMEGLE